MDGIGIGQETDGHRIVGPATEKGPKIFLYIPRLFFPLGCPFLSAPHDHEWKPLLQEEYAETSPQISPDGRWMAYVSLESGQSDIYIRPFPDVDSDKEPVSTGGGFNLLWSPNGQELIYTGAVSLMAVEVETEPKLKLGKPKTLFNIVDIGTIPRFGFDISPDGQRFLMVKLMESTEDESQAEDPPAETPHKINIVLNWFEELKERVPID